MPILRFDGKTRYEKKMGAGYYDLLDHFSQHVHGKPTYQDDGSLEQVDPFFEFLQFLQPVKVAIKKLDQELVKRLFQAFDQKTPSPAHLRHKHLDAFLYAESYTLKRGRKKISDFDHRPSLEEVLDQLANQEETTFDTAESIARSILTFWAR